MISTTRINASQTFQFWYKVFFNFHKIKQCDLILFATSTTFHWNLSEISTSHFWMNLCWIRMKRSQGIGQEKGVNILVKQYSSHVLKSLTCLNEFSVPSYFVGCCKRFWGHLLPFFSCRIRQFWWKCHFFNSCVVILVLQCWLYSKIGPQNLLHAGGIH